MVFAPPQDATIASYTPALKQYYMDIPPENLTYKKRPLFALMPKMVTFEGLNAPIPNMYSNPQGVSANFSSALAAQEPTQLSAFLMTRAAKYGFATLQGEAYLAARSSVGAFVSSFATEIDNAFLSVVQDIHFDLYGDGTGIRSIVAGIAGLVVTLLNVTDVRKFDVGMSLEIAPAPTGAARLSVPAPYITNIDRNLGLITLSQIPTGTIVGDGIYRLGSRGVGLNTTGLAGWLPVGGPSNLPFFGVDRTVDNQRLGGVFLDARGGSVWDAIQTLAQLIDINGGTPDYCILHPLKLKELITQLGSSILYDNIVMQEYANISFRCVIVQTDFGEVRVISDSMATPISSAYYSSVPASTYQGAFPIYMIQSDTFYLLSLDQAPHVIQDDGLFVIRSATEDALQVRLRYLGNVGCRAPGYSGVAVV